MEAKDGSLGCDFAGTCTQIVPNAPPVHLNATHARALERLALGDLKVHAL